MWNRVMDVQQIEILFFSDSRHFCRERECVRLMFEQRIRHHLDFMETHTLVEFGQTSWQCRRDEVNCVTACSEFFAEFRADYSATAVGGIYRDADVHGSLCLVLCTLFRGNYFKVSSAKYKAQPTKNVEAGDPRYRLPLSQLDSPSERGASEGGSIFLLLKFSNEFCNNVAAFL